MRRLTHGGQALRALLQGVTMLLVPAICACQSADSAAPIFATPNGDPIVALASDASGVLTALTDAGQLWRIGPGKSSKSLASGLKRGGFSCQILAAVPGSGLLVSDGADNKDVALLLDQQGKRAKLREFDASASLVSAAVVDPSHVYVGYWGSNGDVSLSFNPTHLGRADDLYGRIATLGEKGELTDIFEGGLPMAMAANGKAELFAAIWGQKGPFRPEPRSYTICDPRHLFWIGLSEKVEIRQIVPSGRGRLISDALYAVSSLACGKDVLYAYGMLKGGKRGIYRLSEGAPPQRLTLPGAKLDQTITSLSVSGDYLYFANVDGKVFRIRPSARAQARAGA